MNAIVGMLRSASKALQKFMFKQPRCDYNENT